MLNSNDLSFLQAHKLTGPQAAVARSHVELETAVDTLDATARKLFAAEARAVWEAQTNGTVQEESIRNYQRSYQQAVAAQFRVVHAQARLNSSRYQYEELEQAAALRDFYRNC